MPSPATLPDMLERAFATLASAVADRDSPFHTPALATIGADGAPALRSVILRAFDPAARTLQIHTDSRSPKVAELRAEPRAGLLGYDPARRLQIRLAGAIALHDRDALAEQAWAGSRDSTRMTYSVPHAPGTPIAAPMPGPDDPAAGRAHFVALVMTIARLDLLLLDPAGHRRARFCWDETGIQQADWIAP